MFLCSAAQHSTAALTLQLEQVGGGIVDGSGINLVVGQEKSFLVSLLQSGTISSAEQDLIDYGLIGFEFDVNIPSAVALSAPEIDDQWEFDNSATVSAQVQTLAGMSLSTSHSLADDKIALGGFTLRGTTESTGSSLSLTETNAANSSYDSFVTDISFQVLDSLIFSSNYDFNITVAAASTTSAAVPEPGSWLIFSIALACIVLQFPSKRLLALRIKPGRGFSKTPLP